MNETNVIEEKERISENKKNLLIIGSIILLLIVLGLGCYFVFKKTTSDSKKIFEVSLDTIYENAIKTLNETAKDKFASNLTINMNLSSNDKNTNDFLKILKDLELGYTYEVDTTKKEFNLELMSNYKNEDLLSLSVTAKDNKNAYVYLNNLYDKYIMVPFENETEIDNMFNNLAELKKFIDNYKIILEKLKVALNKSLKSEYFKSENTTIKLNGEDTNVTKHTLILDEKNLEEIDKSLFNELNNDDEFIKALAIISGTDEKEMKKDFNDSINEKINLENGPINISIYTKNVEFIALDITDNVNTLSLIKENETSFQYKIDNLNLNLEGTFEITKNDNNYNLKIYIDSSELKGTISLNIAISEEIKIPDIDYKKVINVENLTEDDQRKILNNIENNKVLQELTESLAKMFMPELYM